MKNPIKGQIRNPEQIYDIFKSIKDEAQESLIAVYLNQSIEALAYNVLSTGSESATIVEPRDIFGYGFVMRARYIILIHNHPSGKQAPSYEDREIMNNLLSASKHMKMNILDFIIVGDMNSRRKKDNYWSMFDEEEGGEGEYSLGPVGKSI